MSPARSTTMRHKRPIIAQSEPTRPLARLVVRSSNAEGRPMVMGRTAIERSMVSVGSMAVCSVKPIVRTSQQDRTAKFTVYAVHVQNAITGRSWVVYRRYSDFLSFRERIEQHFQNFGDLFPKLEVMVNGLYFPRKHKLRSKMGKVVEHRSRAFHEYLSNVHRIIVSNQYLMHREVCEIGLSILKGFFGSNLVQNPDHVEYSHPKPILQHMLQPTERAVVNQCGNLQTVLEEDRDVEMDEDDRDESLSEHAQDTMTRKHCRAHLLQAKVNPYSAPPRFQSSLGHVSNGVHRCEGKPLDHPIYPFRSIGTASRKTVG